MTMWDVLPYALFALTGVAALVGGMVFAGQCWDRMVDARMVKGSLYMIGLVFGWTLACAGMGVIAITAMAFLVQVMAP